jgi:hypothetical protein
MKKIKVLSTVLLLFTLSSCTKEDIVIDYSSMPLSFELGDQLPILSDYVSVKIGQDAIDVSSMVLNDININLVGEYLVFIDLNELDFEGYGEKIQIEVSVVDTTPPSIKYVRQFMLVNFGFDFNTELISCEDLSGCELIYEGFEYQSSGRKVGRVVATDSHGNVTTEEIDFTVIDNNFPIIEVSETRLRTSEGYAIKLGSEFKLPTISVSDLEDSEPLVEITNNVNVNELGVYEVTIFATDSFGNTTARYLQYHVVDNFQIHFVRHEVRDVINTDEGFLILTNVYDKDPTGNPFIKNNNLGDIDNWNGQTLILVSHDYELKWVLPISSEDIEWAVGIRSINSESIFLFGSSLRELNGLSPCLDNSAASNVVGTILKYDYDGKLQGRSLDFGNNCSSSYTDLSIFNNRIYVVSEAYLDGNKNYASLFNLVILDGNLNELNSLIYSKNNFHGYKIFNRYGVGISVYNNSLWLMDDFNKSVELDFSGNEISNSYFDMFGNIETVSSTDRLVTSYSNICGVSGQRYNNSAINTNGISLINFFDVSVGQVESGYCDSTKDSIIVLYDKNSTLLSSRISELDNRITGFDVVNIGKLDETTGSPYLVFTDKEIVEIRNNLSIDIHPYNVKVDQLSEYYNSLDYQIVLVRDSNVSSTLYSSVVMRDYRANSSVLILK